LVSWLLEVEKTDLLTEGVAEEGSFELTEGKDDGTVVNKSTQWPELFLKTSSHESAVSILAGIFSIGDEGLGKLDGT